MRADARRREILAALVSGVAVGTTGCLGNNETSGPPADPDTVTPVTVEPDDHEVEGADYRVLVRFGTNTTDVLNVPSGRITPEADHKFVVMASQITIRSARTDQIQISGGIIGLKSTGELYEPREVPEHPRINQLIQPTSIYEAWAYFEVPSSMETAKLTAITPGLFFPLPTAVDFEPDPSRNAQVR